MVSSDLWANIAVIGSFKYEELAKVVRQNNKLYTDLLNKIWVGNIDDDVEKLLKVRFLYEYDDKYPEDALHMFAENETAFKRNEAVLNHLSGELYTVLVNE